MEKEKQNETQYKILNKTELPKNKLEVEVEIPSEILESFRSDAIKAAGANLEVDGFRKGKAPENVVIEKVGEMAITEQAAYKAINTIYPLLINKENIEAIGQPQISVTKISPNNPLVFKATVSLMPKIELPDYKKIAKEVKAIEKAEVTDKEIDTYIDFIRSQRAQAEKLSPKESDKKDSDGSKEKDVEKSNDKSNGNSDDKKEPELPELNDEFVKTLGDFKDVADFKAKLKENMIKEKTQKETERRRLEIMEGIIKEAKVEMPDVLVEEELDRMVHEFTDRIKQMRMEPADYFKEIKKTEEDLRKEWSSDAEKRVKMNLILPKIAEKEKIEVDQKIVEKEVAHLKEHHKDLDEFRATVYVTNLLANEEVFKFLEKIS